MLKSTYGKLNRHNAQIEDTYEYKPYPLAEQGTPQGTLLLRTLAMPADTNPNGDIFGGWSDGPDGYGRSHSRQGAAHGRVVTAAVDAITFLKPVAVGDVVCCYGQCVHVGKYSLRVKLEIWVKKVASEPIGERSRVTEATFTYVAVDQTVGRARCRPVRA